jgi:hypothetical protein
MSIALILLLILLLVGVVTGAILILDRAGDVNS